MKISFDPKKDERTRRERGISLSLGKDILLNRVKVVADDRRNYGEIRLVAFGYVGQRLHVCVFTMRDDTYHIISVRKANDRETRKYG